MILRVGILGKKLKRQQIGPSNPLMEHLQDEVEVMKFDCERFSCFSEEKEILFFGGDTVLRIKGIIHRADGKWMKYDKYLEAINVFSRMMGGFSIQDQPIMKRKKDQKMMKLIIKDVLRSLVWQLHEAETPKYVHEMVLFHQSAASHIRLIYDELLTEYKWLDCILKNSTNIAVDTESLSHSQSSSHGDDTLELDAGTVNVANIVLLFCHSESITFLMADDYDLNDAECLALMEDLMLIKQMGLEMTVHLKWPSDLSETNATNLERYLRNLDVSSLGIECRFSKHSASFTASNARIEFEAQRRFSSRVEHLIVSLSRVQLTSIPQVASIGGNNQPSYDSTCK